MAGTFDNKMHLSCDLYACVCMYVIDELVLEALEIFCVLKWHQNKMSFIDSV